MSRDLRLDVLSTVRVASPCPMRWDDLNGASDRVRHCAACGLHVYNFASMRPDEIVGLIERTEGRLCGALHRRADGTMITRDCPTGLARARAAAVRGALVAAALILCIPTMLVWASTRQRGRTLAELEPFRSAIEATTSTPTPAAGAIVGRTMLMGDIAAPAPRP